MTKYFLGEITGVVLLRNKLITTFKSGSFFVVNEDHMTIEYAAITGEKKGSLISKMPKLPNGEQVDMLSYLLTAVDEYTGEHGTMKLSKLVQQSIEFVYLEGAHVTIMTTGKTELSYCALDSEHVSYGVHKDDRTIIPYLIEQKRFGAIHSVAAIAFLEAAAQNDVDKYKESMNK